MGVSLELIKQLREKTFAGMMACQKALEEANGDMEVATEILRKKGEAKADNRAERSAKEGLIAISGRAIIKLLCETDFVARNEQFQNLAKELAQKCETEGFEATKNYFESKKGELMQSIGEVMNFEEGVRVEGGTTLGSYVHSNGKLGAIVILDSGTEEMARDVAMHAVAMNPLCGTPEEINPTILEKEKTVYFKQLKEEGKPENIIEKIMEGKVKKFCADNALSSQPFVKDPSITVQEFIKDAKLIKFVRYAI